MLASMVAKLLELIDRIGMMVRHHAVLTHVSEHLGRGGRVRVVLAGGVGVVLGGRGVHVGLVELGVAHLRSWVVVFLHRVQVLVRGCTGQARAEGEGCGVRVGVLRVRVVELHRLGEEQVLLCLVIVVIYIHSVLLGACCRSLAHHLCSTCIEA